MAGGGVLQFTLLVTVVLCYLMAITSGFDRSLSELYEHDGRNLLPCDKTPKHIKMEENFVRRNGPK